MRAAHPRPRIVDVAFWSWLAGAVLLVVSGLPSQLLSFKAVRSAAPNTWSDQEIKSFLVFYKGAGIMCILLGVAIGFLAIRTRRGEKRARRNAVALSLVGLLLLGVGVLAHVVTFIVLLAIVALIVAVGLITRPSASAWFDELNQPEGDHA
jgi:hypothetical protein